MILEAIITGFVIAIMNHGDLNKINDFKIKNFQVMILGVLLSIITQVFTKVDLGFLTYICVKYYYFLHIGSLLLIAVGFLLNYEYKSLMCIGLGFILNTIPIILNGKMPVNLDALVATENTKTIEIISLGRSLSHGVFENPKAEFLSDIFALKPPYPMARVISLGDVVITVSIVVFIVTLTRRNDGLSK